MKRTRKWTKQDGEHKVRSTEKRRYNQVLRIYPALNTAPIVNSAIGITQKWNQVQENSPISHIQVDRASGEFDA